MLAKPTNSWSDVRNQRRAGLSENIVNKSREFVNGEACFLGRPSQNAQSFSQ